MSFSEIIKRTMNHFQLNGGQSLLFTIRIFLML